ncbi:MAG: S41 family peptidase [Ignavibacteriales bacterium]|nr:S41 family peptidase [Ignavibacteriales bacterium]
MTKSMKSLTILALILMTLSTGNNILAQSTVKSVKIGNQVWMAENLSVSRFRNGDPIPEAKTNEEWARAGREEKPAWCHYNNDPENGKTYGKLYNWYAVNDRRGLAPEGWHIPTIDEFDTLETNVNEDANALKVIGQGPGNVAGTNTSGFSALFAGLRYDDGFLRLKRRTFFWSSTEGNASGAYQIHLDDTNSNIGASIAWPKELGLSVRCLLGARETSEAKPKYKALLDTTFNNGSNIILNNPTNKDYDDLTVLSKLWGFLKYYHPTASKGDVNWDYELFRIMPKVLKCNSRDDRNRILSEWINSLGGIKEKQEPVIIDKRRIKIMPDLEWTDDETELGKVIVAQLKDITTAKRDSSNFYLGIFSTFKHENPYKKMTFPDAGFRLLSLYRYWNIIQYYFPYRNLIEDNWNQVLRDFIPQFVKSSNELEYRLTIHRLIEKIHDSHASIWGNDKVLRDYYGKYVVPCKISFIENKAVVTGVHSALDSTIQLKIGDIIEKVNGESVDEIVKRKLPIYPASKFSTKLRAIAPDVLRCNNESISISYFREGQVKTDNVTCVKLEIMPYSISTSKMKSWKMLGKSIGYIYPGTIKKSELPDMMNNFQNCKGIIIDLRCYPSEPILETLGEYLMPEPIQFAKFTEVNSEMPGMFLFSESIYTTVGKNNPHYFKGKVAIIVNEITQSQAEFTTMAFKKAPRATIIGSPTAGADGDVRQFSLPGDISTTIDCFGVYYPDGGETQRVGIVPDIEIKPTIKGIIEGKDELLDKAIQVIQDSK